MHAPVRALTVTSGDSPEPHDEMDGSRRIDRMVRTYHAFVWRSLRRLGLTEDEADDGAQYVFVTAARKMSLIEPEAERAFLFGTCLRVASTVRRRRRRTTELRPEALAIASSSPEELVDRQRARTILDALLESLPTKFRLVVVLVEIEQCSKSEVAAILGIRPGTVASRLRRARRLLEKRAAQWLLRVGPQGGAP